MKKTIYNYTFTHGEYRVTTFYFFGLKIYEKWELNHASKI